MRRGFAFFVVVFSCSVSLSAQDSPPDEGGLGGFFTKLRSVVEEVSPSAEKNIDDEKSWLERAKELGSSTLGKGKQGFEDLVTSGTEANTKMSGMLTYLDKKMAGREPSFSDAEIQSMAVDLIPLVEELNERKFNSPPKVAVSGNFEMIQILGNDLIPQYQKQFPEVSKSSIFLRSYISAGLFAPALMGKYGVTDKAVYVLPENVKATMEARNIPDKLDRDLMKIIIAHELTHALQDQEVDLNSSLLKVKNPDASLAFQALIEGHAVYIQNAAARRLKLQDAAKAGRDMLTAPEQDGEEWLVNQVAMADAVKWESIY
ncbi:MAG: hypothetical protein P1V20_01925, partial [Verrucomicrobiales bacterium]|nr:hypothetical protein [Verrucomicrobiales bacterium]